MNGLLPAQMERLRGNLENVRRRIESAARRTGRDPASIRLVAVTKTVDAPTVIALHSLGVTDCGENRIQVAADKIPACPAPIRWHLIGHLQTNKARKAAALFPFVHSVDSPDLVGILDREAERLGRSIDGFLEVNIGGEASKEGVAPEALPGLIAAIRGAAHLRWTGLMTMAPLANDPEAARPIFRRLRELRDRYATADAGRDLSMGMTQDFEVAIEEGATLVRVGRALFEGIPGTH